MAEERAQWGSSLEFVLTVIGYAVGLGNVWRFPFLVFEHGGLPFLIPFFIMLFLVGIPIFFLETAIGQFTALSPTHVFEQMAPVFQGLGYAAITINAFIGFYYNVIIAYCIYYLLFSLRANLPWATCNGDPECFKRDLNKNCSEELAPFIKENITIRSPSEIYFYKQVLNLSDGIDNLGGLEGPLVLALLLAWFLVFVALVKGVQSLGKISYFTATFPYIMLTILVIRGALLDGAGEGMNYYILSFDAKKWAEPKLWKDATVQIFYALSACSGGLVSMSSFSAFNNNLIRDAFLVPILDCLTGFYAGFAIFTVLGNMFVTKCVDDFKDVAAQGPELAFVVYPEGLSLMPVAPLFSTFFFVMMLALGFGSEFSIMESLMSTVIDVVKKFANTPKKVILVRLCIVVIYFLFGLTMVTRGGIYVLNLVDSVIAGYPLLVVGLLQVIVVPWIYGTDRLVRDIEAMIGKKSKAFWMIWIISWKFITPITLVAVIISTFIIPSKRVSFRDEPYPDYAVAIGWIIVAVPISFIPGCGIYQIYKYRNNMRQLIQPLPGYYDNYKKQLEKQKADGVESAPADNYELTKVPSNKVSAYDNKAYLENFQNNNFIVSKEDDVTL